MSLSLLVGDFDLLETKQSLYESFRLRKKSLLVGDFDLLETNNFTNFAEDLKKSLLVGDFDLLETSTRPWRDGASANPC